MRNSLSAVLAILLIQISPASSQDAPGIADKVELLKNEVRCIAINDFAIRQLNLFAAETEAISPSGGNTQGAADGMIAMSLTMRVDAMMRYTDLVSTGYDGKKLDGILSDAESNVTRDYIAAYMGTINPSNAKAFVAKMFREQQACVDWYSANIKPNAPDSKAPEKKDNGVNG